MGRFAYVGNGGMLQGNIQFAGHQNLIHAHVAARNNVSVRI